MVMDICLDCGFVHQSVGVLRYTCTRCDRVTYHAVIPRCPDKEDRNLENFYASGLV